MLTETTVTKLREVRLSVMANALKDQMEDPQYKSMAFEDRLGLLVDAEWNARKSNRLRKLIRQAAFSDPGACLENVEYLPDRKIEPFLVLFESEGDSPCKWSKKAMRLMEFDLSVTGDPECCHMAKIGDRWYLFASPAGFTYRYMGKFTYWVSKKGQALKDIDWETAKRYELTGEDLCAGKVSLGKNGEVILYGWIPARWNDSIHSSVPIQWGGNMSFPYLLSQNSDGTLTAKFADDFAKKIRGELLYQKELIGQNSIEIYVPDNRIDMDICFEKTKRIEILFSDEKNMHYTVEIDAQNHCMKVITENFVQTSVQLSNKWMQQKNTLRLVVEEDMIECLLNEKYILPARTCFAFNKKCKIRAVSYGNIEDDMLKWIRIYHLNTSDEVVYKNTN